MITDRAPSGTGALGHRANPSPVAARWLYPS